MAGYYSSDGSLNVTAVSGTSWTGLYALDGSLNVVEDTGSTYKGLYHPCGAINVKVVSAGSYAGAYSANGSMNVFIGTPSSAAPTGAKAVTVVSGSLGALAAALLVGETNGMAIDFTDCSIVIKDTTTPSNAFSGNVNDKLTYTSPGTKWVRNSSGIYTSGTTLRTDHDENGTPLGLLIEEARTNLFLNSRAPVTQNVTVTAAAHTLSFIGTGSITYSGAASGTLNGTGANTRVSATFTPSAGTLTLTVSGSLDFVQIELGPVASSPIVTAGSTVTRAADNIRIDSTLFPHLRTAGTLFVEFIPRISSPNLWVYDDNNSATNRLDVRGSVGFPQAIFTGSGTQDVTGNGLNDIVVGSRMKTAIAHASLDAAQRTNNGTTSTGAAHGVLTASTRLLLTGDQAGSANIQKHIVRVLALPRRMTNTELGTLTTL